MDTVKYSRLISSDDIESPYTCITLKNYGASESRHQELNGHFNPLDVDKTEYPPSNENDLIRLHKPLKDRTKYAFLACILCFFPTGIMAIIYALQARSAWKGGEVKKAREKSSISKDFIRASVCLGGLTYILIILVILFTVIFDVHE
ncbi:proline-rich transmembrane protein 1-like [Ostrea edulis]|uniref:proline-rich transmembrane protein 1-like n=1 Tax=Ostrea edulis TaxID=37623 RepID=UPI0024AEE47D|nr:proline-rich transmembrane protein 1-like [Ostrea edulis]